MASLILNSLPRLEKSSSLFLHQANLNLIHDKKMYLDACRKVE